ncbi:MAG: CAP domain-containing protein [Planctomycetia bacterium]|nr:CAP domain-containing protein [Planctomycetia bacterium]
MKRQRTTKSSSTHSRQLRLETLESRNLLSLDGASVLGVVAVAGENDAQSSLQSEQTANLDEQEDDAATSIWYELVTTLNPSAEEQELLEQINRFRADPSGELGRIFSEITSDSIVARNSLVDSAIQLNSYPKNSLDDFLTQWRELSSASPLAYNASLLQAATNHSSQMKSKNDISHKCAREDDLVTRVIKAGFESGLTNADGDIAISENIGGCFRINGSYSVASYILAAFAVDWGVATHEHRDALMNDAYTEIGISIMNTTKSVGPYLATCDIATSVQGARDDGAYLLGVIYDDGDNDFFYDVGEGLGGVDICIERLGSDQTESVTIQSWNAGSYQIFLLNGSYRVTVSGDSFSSPITKTVSVTDGANVKLDFRSNDAGATAPIVDLNSDAEGYDWTSVFVENSELPAEVLADANISIVDADSSYLYGAKITFAVRPDGIEETLDISVSGTSLRASFEDQSGTVVLTGVGTLEEYVQVISSLTYFNAAELCNLTSNAQITIAVYDGVFWSNDALLTIEIEPTQLPQMTVLDMTTYEGDDGATIATFVVELDSPARMDVSFNFNVVTGGTAVEGDDYTLSLGDPITISAGETTAQIECYVNGNFDALKPEGLKVVDGVVEKPYIYFDIEIVDLTNAYLTNENNLARGYIYDDDSPIALGVADNYLLESLLSTEQGLRRYVFTVTPSSNGYFMWDAASVISGRNVAVAVRENSLEAEPLVLSDDLATNGRVQWFADSEVEYWITVEAADDLSKVFARLLEISEDKIVLVDPLLEDSEEDQVNLAWLDDDMDFSIGDWSWSFEPSLWDQLQLHSSRENVDLVFALPSDSYASLSDSSDDETSITFDDYRGITTVGFSSFTYNGEDNHETLVLEGTDGDDYLYYSEGSGFFRTSDGKIVTFNKVNNVTVNGGSGNSFAFIQDSQYDDTLETTNDTISLYGGGFSLVASNFTKAQIVMNSGGEDTLRIQDSGDQTEASLSKSSAIITGVYDLTGSDSSTVSKSYARTVIGASQIVVDPTDYIGVVKLYGDNSPESYINATFNTLSSYDQSARFSTTVTRAKSITVGGVHPFYSDTLTISLSEGYESQVVGDTVVLVNVSTGSEIIAPSWVQITTIPEEPTTITSDSLLANTVDDALGGVSNALIEPAASVQSVCASSAQPTNVSTIDATTLNVSNTSVVTKTVVSNPQNVVSRARKRSQTSLLLDHVFSSLQSQSDLQSESETSLEASELDKFWDEVFDDYLD